MGRVSKRPVTISIEESKHDAIKKLVGEGGFSGWVESQADEFVAKHDAVKALDQKRDQLAEIQREIKELEKRAAAAKAIKERVESGESAHKKILEKLLEVKKNNATLYKIAWFNCTRKSDPSALFEPSVNANHAKTLYDEILKQEKLKRKV